MKNVMSYLILILCLSLMLVACESVDKNTIQTDNKVNNVNTCRETNRPDIPINPYTLYRKIWSGSENQATFYKLVANNPIDSSYYANNFVGTTNDTVELLLEYSNIWLEELEYSCDGLSILLDEGNKAEFEDLQNKWGEYLSAQRSFERELFNESDSGFDVGRIYTIECAAEYLDIIRERTLYVKYLQFCINTSNHNTELNTIDFLFSKNTN